MSDNFAQPQIATLQEAARMIRVCVRTVYREIDDGELPKPKKIRSRSFLPIAAIRAYLEKRGLPPPEGPTV